MGRIAAEHSVSADEFFWQVLALVGFLLLFAGVMRLWIWRASRDPVRAARNTRATFKALTTGWPWPLWLSVLAATVTYAVIVWAQGWAEWALAPIAGLTAILLLMLPHGSFRRVRRRPRG